MLKAAGSIMLSHWGTQNYCQVSNQIICYQFDIQTKFLSFNLTKVIVFTDCGIGLGPMSLRNTVMKLKTRKHAEQYPMVEDNILAQNYANLNWIPFSNSSKLSFMCLGHTNDNYFREALKLYQELLDISGQNGELFVLKIADNVDAIRNQRDETGASQYLFDSIKAIVDKMCETNFTPFEAVLKCGGYLRLESPIIIWPTPLVILSFFFFVNFW